MVSSGHFFLKSMKETSFLLIFKYRENSIFVANHKKIVMTLIKNTFGSCILLVAFMIFTGCSKTKDLPTFKEKDVAMWMEKGSCLGKCAVYSLKIYKNGQVLYTGKANTDKMGQFYKMIPETEFKEMQTAFEESGFLSFDSIYVSGVDDFPLITLGMMMSKQRKTIKYKENRPEPLYKLQLKMEKLANSFDWTPMQKDSRVLEYKPIEGRQNNADDGVHIKNEIIIQPKVNVNMDNWVGRYQGYEVKVVKKIAPNLSYYLITWNTNIISPEEILQKIKSDMDIQSAEFNKKIMQRED